MRTKHFILFFFILLLTSKSFATHIVGGELYYDCLGNNNYRITLKVYRDCCPTCYILDNPGYVFIFNSAGVFIDSMALQLPGTTQLPPTINNPCYVPPANVCVEEGIYQRVIKLPALAGGYDIVYQRCCRNNTILNLINPGSVGSTYMTHIPDPGLATCNSSPRFKNFPPIVLCAGVALFFDHSATDPDGDSLYYELCDPFTGLDQSCPQLGAIASVSGCPEVASPPPYPFVPWLAPYNATNPMSASPGIAVDHVTGLMTGTPNMIGQWVVGVCVSEYRHGILLDVNKRDFQFNVVNCPNLSAAALPVQTRFCFGYKVDFTQNSVNAFSYHWDFGDPSTNLDSSHILSPTWTYPDSGIYSVKLIINEGTICADSQTNILKIYPLLDPNYTPPPSKCVADNSFNFSADGSYMGNGTFSWDFGAKATPPTSNQKNPTNIIFDTAGTYPVSLTVSENGCTKTYLDSVHVYPMPKAIFGDSAHIGCGFNRVNFTDSSKADTPLKYDWRLGNGTTSTSKNPTVDYSSPGTYNVQLVVTSQHGCKDSAQKSIPLTINELPIAGFDVTPKDTSLFYSNISMIDQSQFATGCEVYWGDGTKSKNCDTIHHYTQPGTYTIMQVVVNAVGCYDTAYYSSETIRPEFLFYVPNAFTPNSNGLNDVFKPMILGVHNYKFLIFDRWGEKIFETSNMQEGWNGYYHSKLCSNDVYAYKITFIDDVENKSYQYIGRVTLVR